jgi:glycyl-tRNA synthetase
MSAADEDVYAVQAQVTLQQSKIREMKKGGEANAQEILDQVTVLNELRLKLQKFTDINKEKEVPFNRKGFDELILRKMYVVPSFEIHNGPAGLFDYGPPACTLKANVLQAWRRHFVLEEGMLEMECTCLTPSSVLETSGHVERFTDFMVKDTVTAECFRADKLLEEAIDALLLANPNMDIREQEEHKIIQRQADAFTATELHAMLLQYKVKSPSNPENSLTEPFPFNLMFKTTIGPEGTAVGFLRPETAQGLFVNFRYLADPALLLHLHLHLHLHQYLHIHAYIYMHTYTYTCIHIHIHAYTLRLRSLGRCRCESCTLSSGYHGPTSKRPHNIDTVVF